MASNYEKAAYRVRHSLLRRAAGEHTVDATTLVRAFAEEWRLSAMEHTKLKRLAEKTLQEIKEKR